MGRIEKGQPAHAAEEHERHEHAPGGAVRLGGDADGETHGADGGGPFKEAVQEGQPVPVADEEASRHKQYEIHEKDREGQPDGFRRKPAAEALHVPAEAEGGRGGRQQGVEGGGLDAPCGGARPAADEHENDEHHPPSLGEGGEVHGIEARRAGGDGLEERRHDALPAGEAREVEEIEEERRPGDEHHRGGEDHFRLEAAPGEAPAVGEEVRPGDEAQPAGDDEAHDGEIDDGIAGVVHEGAPGLDDAHEVEAGIAEGGHGVKDREPHAADEAEIRDEYGSHEARPEELEAEGAPEDDTQDLHEAPQLRRRHRFLEGIALHEADVPAGKDRQHHGEGHHAHAADLDEQQDHQLAEEGPVGAGIDGDEAGDAHRGHGGEEGVHESRPAVGGEGQQKEDRPCGDGCRKAGRDDLKGRQLSESLHGSLRSLFRLRADCRYSCIIAHPRRSCETGGVSCLFPTFSRKFFDIQIHAVYS